MRLAILLSTYNGSEYLEEQINSIFSQTYNSWELYIRDDGSNDGTLDIINEYAALNRERVFLIKDNLGNVQSAISFMQLLDEVQADYYMFCDQDDFWLPSKIELTLLKMIETEKNNSGKGVLIFSDLTLVDNELNLIHESMWEYVGIDPEKSKNIYKVVNSSCVTGCTIMINNKLKEQVLPYPSEALMHDWWITLNAAFLGVVEYLNEPTVLYRQHNNNVLGVEVKEPFHYFIKFLHLKETINGNIRVIKALKKLRFNFNYAYFYLEKLKTILRLN